MHQGKIETLVIFPQTHSSINEIPQSSPRTQMLATYKHRSRYNAVRAALDYYH